MQRNPCIKIKMAVRHSNMGRTLDNAREAFKQLRANAQDYSRADEHSAPRDALTVEDKLYTDAEILSRYGIRAGS